MASRHSSRYTGSSVNEVNPRILAKAFTAQTSANATVNDSLQVVMANPDLLKQLRVALGAPQKKPIGSVEDDDLLVSTLLDSAAFERTYKQALDSLDQANGYSASVWKDYYLDRKWRFDALIEKDKIVDSEAPSVTKPVSAVESTPLHRQPQYSAYSGNTPSWRQRKASATASISESRPRAQDGSTDLTAHSLSLAATSFAPSLKSPVRVKSVSFASGSRRLQTLPTPSRSPSPPTEIVKLSGGKYKFTADDDQFLLSYIKYALSANPNFTRSQITEMVAKKAPHHSVRSWANRWSVTEEASDIFNRYCYNSEGKANSDSPILISDDEEQADDEFPSSSPSVSIGQVSVPSTGRRPVTETVKKDMARYLASRTDRDVVSQQSLWNDFSQKFPEKSSGAWTQNYKYYKNEIDSAVAEYTATALNRRRIEEASLKRSSFAEDAEAAHEYHKTKKSKASQ